MSDESAPQHRVERSRPTRLRALADFYPDGILGASREGVVTILNAQGAALLGVDAEDAKGLPLSGRAAVARPGRPHLARRQPALRRHLDHARRARAVVAQRLRRRGPHHRALGPRGAARAGRRHRGRAAQRSRSGAARPRALRPRRHRRPRAALPPDGRQGLRAGAAQPVGQAQRRPAQADAPDGERRCRPTGPPHRRAARRRPDRHRSPPAVSPRVLRRGARAPGRGLHRGRDRARHQASRSRTSCRRCSPTRTSSPRS